MQTKSIPLHLPRAPYQYEVLIGQQCLGQALGELLHHYKENRVFIVTNDRVAGLYPGFIEGLLPSHLQGKTLILPDGEEHKSFASIQKIYDFLAEERANRNSWLIAFGGGVIGDMAGFAAATFMRGMGYIQIPTTLLSQVDSSIGGKTGYNHKAGKNFIGAFKQPLQTIIDTHFLKTLPQREFVAGYAELIKHALIRDSYLFEILHKDPISTLLSQPEHLQNAIHRSCEVKAQIVQADENESGERAKLNFGHTLGHYFETFTEYKKYLHGECILAGLEFATWWSVKHCGLRKEDAGLIQAHLHGLGVQLQLDPIGKAEFIEIIEHDKKASSKGIRFVGLTALGQSILVDNVTAESLYQDYQEFLSLGNRLVQQSLKG